MHFAKMAERIEVQFWMETIEGLRYSLLDKDLDLPKARRRKVKGISPIIRYTITTFSTHSPDGASFDAAFIK